MLLCAPLQATAAPTTRVLLYARCTRAQARDEPSFFDKLGECISLICQAACDHQVKLQSGFISIALSVKVVEGALLQVDPLCVVAPRAKAVVVREHMRRKGAKLLGGVRNDATGDLVDNEGGKREDELIKEARRRAEESERKLEEQLAEVEKQKRADQQQRLEARAARGGKSDWSGR